MCIVVRESIKERKKDAARRTQHNKLTPSKNTAVAPSLSTARPCFSKSSMTPPRYGL
jgi:hypothetical protein